MLIINYKGITPQQNFYSIGVKTNNKANVIRFVLSDLQEDLEIGGLTPYLKVQSKEHGYIDKIALTSRIVEDLVELDWTMTAKSTQYRNLELQIQFQSNDDDKVVWQSMIVGIELAETIKADEEINEKYPTELQQIEKAIADWDKDFDSKQDKLVSGENIKTIDGEDVLGSGNLALNKRVRDLSEQDMDAFTPRMIIQNVGLLRVFSFYNINEESVALGYMFYGNSEEEYRLYLCYGASIKWYSFGEEYLDTPLNDIGTSASANLVSYEQAYMLFLKKVARANKIYATDGESEQITLEYGTSADGNTIVQRNSNGQIEVPLTPTANAHATSKEYVDNHHDDTKSNATNVENGTATGGLKQKTDANTFTLSCPKYGSDETKTTGSTGQYSTELGGKSLAEGKRAVAEGTQTYAKGNYSHAEGNNSVAEGNNSHAEGLQNYAKGAGTHAEGQNCMAGGNYSHAEGNNNTANGSASHAEGTSNVVRGDYAHIGGRNNEITTAGEGAFAHGQGIYLNQPYQVGFGKYNEVDSNAIFSVGYGTSESDRKSAFKVNADGSATIGHAPTNDLDVATKQYVDNNKSSKQVLGQATLSYDSVLNYYKMTLNIPKATLKQYDILVFTMANSYVFFGVSQTYDESHSVGSFLNTSTGNYMMTRVGLYMSANSCEVRFGTEYDGGSSYSSLGGALVGIKL